MKTRFDAQRAFIVALSAVALASPLAGAQETKKDRDAATIEQATRLQIFLDEANFGPGKIDGRYGEFTKRALRLYLQAQGKSAVDFPSGDQLPDLAGIGVERVNPVFTTYTVSDIDVDAMGSLPEERAAQARLKWMPYRTAAEAVAEKFHCDLDFLKELNPGLGEDLKAGDQVRVPNVTPFDLNAVKNLQPGSYFGPNALTSGKPAVDPPPVAERTAGPDEADGEREDDSKKGESAPEFEVPPSLSIYIKASEQMLQVRDGEKTIAAFPVTVGSSQTETPVGEWKVVGVAKLPDFRWDEKMLKEGERSDEYHLLPPGPNNPVGVIWIALNRKGIGIHGTDAPDTIGRSASHGCIRLANWDAVKVATMVKGGVPVRIENGSRPAKPSANEGPQTTIE